MRSLHILTSAASLIALPPASALPPGEDVRDVALALRDASELDLRAFPDNPSGAYKPAIVDCPSDRPVIRPAVTLSTAETNWLRNRRNLTIQPLREFLSRANITGFDAAGFINDHAQNLSAIPNIGIAVSGGGYRALLNGAGFVAAADSRTPGSSDGGIGGLLQASTYLAGLSGGGWLVSSIYANNFSTVTNLRDGSSGSNLWRFNNSIFTGPAGSGIQVVNVANYWMNLANEVGSKNSAGYETSITDYWGRALSYQMVNATDGGPAYTFSSIAKQDTFSSAQAPFPILVADGRQPNNKIISLNATNYEFNPFEIGSWDPTVYGFAPTRYVGSNFSAGSIPTNGRCVQGFDQIGYVMGTSSSLFNQFILQNITSFNLPSFVTDAIQDILTTLGDDNNDIAQWSPNPFLNWRPESNYNAQETQLSLVDGGEDLQNIPLNPLIQPNRGVDVVFAVDSSADTTYNYPNGTALRATYQRGAEPISNGTQFPVVPDAETFINLNLSSRPAFFGCDTKNFTGGGHIPPLIVYVPLAPYTAFSNVTTFTPTYTEEEKIGFIQNGFNVATMGNRTLDDQWPTCVACAVLSRSLEKTGTAVPSVCSTCFQRYCWNGTLDQRAVPNYEPKLILPQAQTKNAGVSFKGEMRSLPWIVAALVMTMNIV